MGQNLAPRFENFVLFSRNEERERLVFSVGNFNMGAGFLHYISAYVVGFPFAEFLAGFLLPLFKGNSKRDNKLKK